MLSDLVSASTLSILFILFNLILHSVSQVLESKACLLAGAVWPAPSHLSRSDALNKARASFTEELDRAFKGNSTYGALDNTTSFSIDIYSLYEEESLLTHHYSAPELSHPESGVAEVDSNTIYRIGSISKLFTTYVYLINSGFTGWNDPITKYLPELVELMEDKNAPTNDIDTVNWDEVTVGGLACHLSGMSRDGAYAPSTDAKIASLGIPKVPGVPGAFCGDPAVLEVPCNDEGMHFPFIM